MSDNSPSNYVELSDALNPFQRRSRIAHSPVRNLLLTPEQERDDKQQQPVTPGKVNGDKHQHKECVSIQAEKRESEEEPLYVMGKRLRELISMMEVQRHINMPMRELVSAIDKQHQRALAMYSIAKPPTVCTNKGTQTTEADEHVINRHPKRARIAPGSGRESQLKSKSGHLELPKLSIDANLSQQQQRNTNQSKGEEATQSREGWIKVVRHKSKTNQSKPTKSDALVLRKVGELSYADMLKKIKAQPELKELSQCVKGIRKTAKDELLFELKRQADPATDKLKAAVEAVLGDSASVRSLTQETAIEIKDIDEVTSREEVLEAIANSLPDEKVTLSAIRSMRAAYGGTQTCTISLPSASAQKLLILSKIRIGWVYCRLREKVVLTRCYKCHDFGHVARNCQSEEDRTTCCFRCGGQDHKAKCCTNAPRCALCLKQGKSDHNHVSGNRTCPIFLRAKAKYVAKIQPRV